MKSDELQELLALGEGLQLEFKASGTAHLGREICAMANSLGGRICIGVEDSGKIRGVSSPNKLLSEIQSVARNLDPPISVNTSLVDKVVVVTVPESREKPHSANGKFYLHEGASSQQMNRDEIREFFYKEGLIYFDEKINTRYAYPDDLPKEQFDYFLKESGLSAELSRDNVLMNLGLLKNHKMTNAGALIFCRNSAVVLPGAVINCNLFQGNTKIKILDQKILDADLIGNYDNAIKYLVSHLNSEYIIDFKRKERLELPEVALREALLNAIAHRDYRKPAALQLHIYSNRVEIINPGGLVGGLKMEELGNKSMPRNPLLFSMMHRMHLVENIGSGFKRINSAMYSYGMPFPEIEADESWFTIRFWRLGKNVAKETTQETTRETTQEKIIKLLLRTPEITRNEIAANIGMSAEGVKYHLNVLRRSGRIRHTGPTKKGRWEVLDKE